MEPKRHFAIRERVGQAFAESEFVFRDRFAAATALGATAGSRFYYVRHALPRVVVNDRTDDVVAKRSFVCGQSDERINDE